MALPKRTIRNIKGFTLIEMIVVLSLVVISSSIVLFNYRGARQGTILNSTALDIASMIRLAQNGGRSASKYYEDPESNETFQEDVIKIVDNTQTANTSISTGIYFYATTDDYQISDIIVYKNQDAAFGFNTTGKAKNASGNDVELEVKNLSSSSAVKLYACSKVENYSVSCDKYKPINSPTRVFIEFTRLQSDPIIDPPYKTALGSSGQPTFMLELANGAEVIRKFIIVEKTGNIFVR